MTTSFALQIYNKKANSKEIENLLQSQAPKSSSKLISFQKRKERVQFALEFSRGVQRWILVDIIFADFVCLIISETRFYVLFIRPESSLLLNIQLLTILSRQQSEIHHPYKDHRMSLHYKRTLMATFILRRKRCLLVR